MDHHSSSKPELCLCRATTGIFLTRRQASALLSAGLICLLLCFITGFFWGRRQPLQALTTALVHGRQLVNTEQPGVSTSMPVLDQLTGNATTEAVEPARGLTPTAAVPAPTLTQYRAELGSFSSLKSAQRFAQKLQQAGFTVQIKTRRRSAGTGQPLQYYQVVTEQFPERPPLTQLLTRLQQQIPTAQIKIVTAI